MGRDDIPYLHVMVSKGRTYRYYRRDGKRWAKLDGTPGTIEFALSYDKAQAKYEGRNADRHVPGSLNALIAVYKGSTDYKDLGANTKATYNYQLKALGEKFGKLPVNGLEPRHVLAYRDQFAEAHSAGNDRIKVLRKLYAFAIIRGLAKTNPALGIKKLSEGSREAWPEEIIQKFRDANPAPEVLWVFQMALYTGQRRGDLCKMLWSHFDGEGIEVVQSKTGARLWVPAHPDLKATLSTIPKRQAVILTTPKGGPWHVNHMTRAIRLATAAAGIKGYVLHGLRKSAASYLAEAGCTDAEIMSITGHRTTAMVRKYTAGARQKRLAKSAIAKMPTRNRDEK